jgi:cytochrome-b5 reductase
VFGLEPAGCCVTRFKQDNGKFVIRPYTPISDQDLKGIVEFVIKIYPTGKMGNHINSLKINETLSFKGPILKYKWESNKHKEIALLGGGSGITPLYQLMHTIDRNPDDKTKVILLYGNVTPEDILIKEELDALAKKNPDQFKIKYFVDKPSNDWKGETGFITKDVLRKTIFPASADNVKVFVCGPPPFYDAISGNKVSPQDQGELVGALKDLGFTKEQVFKF